MNGYELSRLWATKEFLQALNEEIAQSENSAMAFYEKNSVLTLF